MSAIRKLATEAAENDLLDPRVAQGIVSLKGVSQSGTRAGNWLSREQTRGLLAQPEIETTEGKRDRAILAVLFQLHLERVRFKRGPNCRVPNGALASRCSMEDDEDS